MSNTVFDTAMPSSAIENQTMLGLAATANVLIDTPSRPSAIVRRRGHRSTIRPSTGERTPPSSLTLSATPRVVRLTPVSRAIVARNGGANR